MDDLRGQVIIFISISSVYVSILHFTFGFN